MADKTLDELRVEAKEYRDGLNWISEQDWTGDTNMMQTLTVALGIAAQDCERRIGERIQRCEGRAEWNEYWAWRYNGEDNQRPYREAAEAFRAELARHEAAMKGRYPAAEKSAGPPTRGAG